MEEACDLLKQSIIHVHHDDLLLDEDEENDQTHDDNVRLENDDSMEVDDDDDDNGDSSLNQATLRHSRRAENTIAYEDFTDIREKIISKLKVGGRKLTNLFYRFQLYDINVLFDVN